MEVEFVFLKKENFRSKGSSIGEKEDIGHLAVTVGYRIIKLGLTRKGLPKGNSTQNPGFKDTLAPWNLFYSIIDEWFFHLAIIWLKDGPVTCL